MRANCWSWLKKMGQGQAAGVEVFERTKRRPHFGRIYSGESSQGAANGAAKAGARSHSAGPGLIFV